MEGTFKIESKVFDSKTLLTIMKIMEKGVIKSVESVVKEGKESMIVSAKDRDGRCLAMKIYKTLHCDFKSRWKYLVLDPRFKNIKKERRAVVNNWCKREFKNLKKAYESGVNCPQPILFKENVLVMTFIGENCIPAPRLIDIDLNKSQIEDIYSKILNEIKKLFHAGIIHSDLSPYNVLILYDQPYLIDFSQAITKNHPLANEWLERDVKNINRYFSKFGLQTKNLNEIIG